MYSLSLFFLRCEARTLRWVRDFCLLSVYPPVLKAGNCIPLCLPTLSVTSIRKTRSHPRIHRQRWVTKWYIHTVGHCSHLDWKASEKSYNTEKSQAYYLKWKGSRNKRMNAMEFYYIFFWDRVSPGCHEIHNIELVSDSLRSTCLCFLSLGLSLWTLIWGIS